MLRDLTAAASTDACVDCRDDDKFHEECGVFAVHGRDGAARLARLGLYALQHRGQEAAGIVSFDGEHFHAHRRPGLVSDIFGGNVSDRLPGSAAIGHNRYSTAGGAGERNIQPLFADLQFGGIALAHNGNLTNAYSLRSQLVRRGAIFQSTSDTEVVIHLMALARSDDVISRLIEALRQVEGAYSMVCLTAEGVIGVRDPRGIRPLVLGQVDGSYVLASETAALDMNKADFVRDIEPGEMVVLDQKGVTSYRPFQPVPSRFCVFEYIYFARPDSIMEGRSVYAARKQIGVELAKEAPAGADVVIPVPDSGVPSAIGYAEQSNLPFELGIIRNHYTGRTFIEPTDDKRDLAVRMKHNANRLSIDGKRVVLVDDSIVRGTTSTKIVEMVRNAGATEVHMRISSPPTRHSCHYGIDTPDKRELLAHQYSVDEMRDKIGVDSLAFISMDGLYRAMGETGRDENSPQYCDACFSGAYSAPLIDQQRPSEEQGEFTRLWDHERKTG